MDCELAYIHSSEAIHIINSITLTKSQVFTVKIYVIFMYVRMLCFIKDYRSIIVWCSDDIFPLPVVASHFF